MSKGARTPAAKLLAIIKREYVERLRTPAFWIATILVPAGFLLMFGIQIGLARKMRTSGTVAVVDLTGRLFQALVEEERLRRDTAGRAGDLVEASFIDLVPEPATQESLAEARKKLNGDVKAKRIKGYLILPPDFLTSGKAEYRAISTSSDMVGVSLIRASLRRAAVKERLRDAGVAPELFERAQLRVELSRLQASDAPEAQTAEKGQGLIAVGVLFFLLYTTFFMYGQFVMQGVVDEKSNRIVEVVISSVRPTHLMLGKILGVGLVGLTQYLIWSLFAANVSVFFGAMAGAAGIVLPTIPLGTLMALVGFFVLGFLFYGSLYAAMAAPFKTIQEAQQFVFLPIVFLVLPTFLVTFVMNDPGSTFSRVVSLIPFFTPLLMFLRIAVQTPPAWEIVLSIVLLVTAIHGMAWLAGRIYRVGILMYGKKPTIPEMWRWVREQ